MPSNDALNRARLAAAELARVVAQVLEDADVAATFDVSSLQVTLMMRSENCGVITAVDACRPTGQESEPRVQQVSLADLRNCLARAGRLLELIEKGLGVPGDVPDEIHRMLEPR